MTPAVSVVIPTWQRPDLVLRAAKSVLTQTFADLEVVVVVDGRDAETAAALESLGDARLRAVLPASHLGNAEARNLGVQLAVAPYVAFLDDDDTWRPSKLEHQMRCISTMGERAIVSCRFIARGEAGDMTWPRRFPSAGEDLGEYFFCRSTPFTGEGMVITSTVLTTRILAREVPFNGTLRRHVDTDWLLRVARVPGFRLMFAGGEALVEWNIEHSRSRITTRRDWAESLDWGRGNRALLTDRAFAAFLLHVVGANAAAQHAWGAFPTLLREALRDGSPSFVDVASHCANFALPATVQRHIAAWFARLESRRKPLAAVLR